jgi:hypothetical protein
MMRMMTRSPFAAAPIDSQTGEWTLLQRLERSTIFGAVVVCDDDNHVLSPAAAVGLVADFVGAVVMCLLAAEQMHFHLQQSDHLSHC